MISFKTIVLFLVQALSLPNVKASCPYNPNGDSFEKCNTPTVLTPNEDFCNLGPKICDNSKYRSIDGSCNNLDSPQFGLANYKLARLLPSRYSDGIRRPANSVTGGPLPNARLISLSLFGEVDVPDPDFTLMNMQWAQVIAADLGRAANGTFSNHYVPCCAFEGRYIERNPEICFNLDIPPGDLLNFQAGNECMDFVRSLTDAGSNCNYNGGPVQQLNAVTSYMDMSTLYGSTDDTNRLLRAFQGGRLISEERNGHTWPLKNPFTTQVCNVEDENGICYVGGDIRVNSSPGVSIFAVLGLREHNRLADELSKLNPYWSDEVLFQEARKIQTAQFQQISYYELLPILLGRENMLKNKLIYDVPTADSYVNDYNPKIDATVLNEFSTAAYRHFHSLCEGRLDLMSEPRSVLGSLRLSDWFSRPEIIEIDDNFDALTRGMVSQPQQLADININRELKHFIFRRNKEFGIDMSALDTHRGRDHGLPSYNDLREFCGIKRANTWEDFSDLINANSIEGLKSLYASPEDVDLNVGGSLENLVPGTLAGPTFLCILTEQFYRTRVGDRYFFENDNPNTGFTKDQLAEIRKGTAARFICDNGNQLQTIQRKAFITVSKKNPIVPCAELPALDLSKWIDTSPAHSNKIIFNYN